MYKGTFKKNGSDDHDLPEWIYDFLFHLYVDDVPFPT